MYNIGVLAQSVAYELLAVSVKLTVLKSQLSRRLHAASRL